MTTTVLGRTPQVGEVAPDFTLPDTEMKPRSLSEFKGQKVVLAFFIGAFTGVCTKEMCAFRDSMDKLTDLKAQVIGVSVNDPFSNREFADKNRLPFPVLSDVNRQVVHAYNLELHNFAGIEGYTVAKRSIFVLDRNGVVRYRWITEDPSVEPNYNEVEQALEQIPN